MEPTSDVETTMQSLSGEIPAIQTTLSWGLIGLYIGLM